MDFERVIFQCENSTDGIFSAIYDAWDSKLGHNKVALQIQGMETMELFASYREVPTNHEKAAKVAATLRKRFTEEDYEAVFQASLSRHPQKADALYRMVVMGLSGNYSQALIRNLAHPAIHQVFECSRQVWHEAHRYTGFVRFQELKSGVLFSRISPLDQVLPLIGEHFSDRFGGEDFCIFDENHQSFLIHQANQPWMLARDLQWSQELAAECSESEKDFQRWWKGFCTSISIEERHNRKVQMQNLPLRFRNQMSEMKKDSI